MIQQLELHNFKCFREQPFELRALTVLCGYNGVGKSSVIQSLLIAQQASGLHPGESRSVRLNGPFGMELGTVADVFCHSAQDNVIEIRLKSDDKLARLSCSADDTVLENQFLSASLHDHALPTALQLTSGFHFTYLSAERQGPRDTQPTQSRPQAELTVGAKGEFAAEVLSRFERDEVRPEMRQTKNGSERKLLLQQVEDWMGSWVPSIQIRPEAYPGTNIAAIRIRKREVTSDWMRPPNIGFGVSHSLPIVIAGLLATKGGLFIVDTPESHLHPSGQSAMGQFLATIAASGVQVIVETHSDHILNGIRLAVASPDNALSNDQAIVYQNSTDEDGLGKVEPLTITGTGSLTAWPAGFFDQTERDLAALSELRKRKP